MIPKFRLRDKFTGKVVSGNRPINDMLCLSSCGRFVVRYTDHHGWTGPQALRFGIDDYIVEPFIGKLDENGIEIYEGDIVKNTTNDLAAVKWDDRNAVWSIFPFYGCPIWELWEVIGNATENPELLK